jgi:MurNAc alpha-1-phosphate uridylyltransferase
VSAIGPIETALILAGAEAPHDGPIFGGQPTALVQVYGETVLDRVIDRLEAAGTRRVVIDAGASGPKVEAHLQKEKRKAIAEVLAENGKAGGTGDQPFYLVSADAFWFDGYRPALSRLQRAWNGERFDALLLLYLTPHAVGYAGMGDFALDPFGRARFRPEREVVPYAYTGVALVHPRLFKGTRPSAATLAERLHEAEAAERLGGIVHDGLWFRLASDDDLQDIEGRFRRGEVQYGPG